MTQALPVRLQPTDAEISEFIDRIGGPDRDAMYPFSTGYLGSIVGSLADAHTRCRIKDCRVCWNIRRGLALVAAIDHIVDTPGGAR